MVRAGEVVPVDGAVQSELAVIDESTLTGEPLPVTHGRGSTVSSGTLNAGEAFDMRATRTSSEGAYAGIVALVKDAEQRKRAVRPNGRSVRRDPLASNARHRWCGIGVQRRSQFARWRCLSLPPLAH